MRQPVIVCGVLGNWLVQMCFLPVIDVLSLSVRDGLAAYPALLPHLPARRLRQPADHRGPDAEQAHADRHQLLPAVAGSERLDDGHLLHAVHSHPKYAGRLHLRSRDVQSRHLPNGWGWNVFVTLVGLQSHTSLQCFPPFQQQLCVLLGQYLVISAPPEDIDHKLFCTLELCGFKCSYSVTLQECYNFIIGSRFLETCLFSLLSWVGSISGSVCLSIKTENGTKRWAWLHLKLINQWYLKRKCSMLNKLQSH